MARVFALAFLIVTPLRALERNEWKYRQSLVVAQPGVVKVMLPPATLDLARSNLEDLRVIDAAGAEIPFVIERAAPATAPGNRRPDSFRATLRDTNTELLIATGTTAPLQAVTLSTPAPAFLKAARIEIATDGQAWDMIESGVPLFRQFGTEQLRLDLHGRTASHVRITIDDSRSRAVPFTNALLAVSSGPPVATSPLAVRISRREEFAGETVLTVDLGARNVPLANLQFVTTEPLFARRIAVGIRELRDAAAVERTIATGSIYRIGVDGLTPRAQLTLPVEYTSASRELLVHVQNGDSPVLQISGLQAQVHPTYLVMGVTSADRFTVLTGNPDVPAPHYDLATLAASFHGTAPSAVTLGVAELNAGFRRADPLAGTILMGAPLNPEPWSYRKSITLSAAGVQELELDLDVLSRARPSLPDLRLVRNDTQIPYLVERPALSRSMPLTAIPAPEPKRPAISRWEIRLPHAGAPLNRLTLASPTTLFQRQIRVYETIEGARGDSDFRRPLAEAAWSHTPADASSTLTLPLASPLTDTISIETDNGDNPPLMLGGVQGSYPVARLLFRTELAPLALYYGNREAAPPRYDLALVAAQILSAEKNLAQLGPEEVERSGGWAASLARGARGGVFFWAALALVVVVLLTVVAKLLPKPPGPDA